DGITVKWNVVAEGVRYRVFYRVKGASSWTKAADVENNSYTVKGLSSGTNYSFTVRCIDESGKFISNIAASKNIQYVATPSIASLALTTNGMKVTWNKVSGASKYRVLYKISGEKSWKTVGDTTAANYTVNGLTSGKTYVFTVRCVNKAGTSFMSGLDSTGKSKRFVKAPSVSEVSNAAKGVTVKWKASSGAYKYRVLYKVSGGSWKKAGDTSSTNYTVTGLTSGKTYSFTVRCLNNAGSSFTSAYDTTGKSLLYLAMPGVSAKPASKGVKVTWTKVSGAAGYYVYRKVSGGSWTKNKPNTSQRTFSYTDTTRTSGKKYYYSVRAYKGNVMSYYKTQGVAAVAK
ncbi:MAG: fibronectin type III domain-containing protein, partial [Eubacteriales bacterium]|nr:fibronectin type III domain-containing protein [Eubacteriales bacterium]